MQSLIFHYIFLFNWHKCVEICFDFDIKEGFFVIFLVKKANLIWPWLIYKSNKRVTHPRGWILMQGTVCQLSTLKHVLITVKRHWKCLTRGENFTYVLNCICGMSKQGTVNRRKLRADSRLPGTTNSQSWIISQHIPSPSQRLYYLPGGPQVDHQQYVRNKWIWEERGVKTVSHLGGDLSKHLPPPHSPLCHLITHEGCLHRASTPWGPKSCN